MPTVAEQLRQAREAQKLDIYQVAEITKIKTDHVRALEAGQWDTFMAPVYIRGFVRNYAKLLRLDERAVMADLDAELRGNPKFCEPPKLTNQSRSPLDFLAFQVSRLNWRWALVLAVVGLIVFLVVFILRQNSRRQENPLKKLGTGLYQSKPETGGETLPLPSPAPKR